MVLIAFSALLFSAWLFNREYRNSQHGWTSSQIAALERGEPERRRQAAENLHNVEFDDLPRTVSVLAGALADPDWQVRHAAARSLPAAIGSLGGITNSALIKYIDLAARTLIEACHDPRDEVRIKAIQSLGKLYETPFVARTGRSGLVADIAIGSAASASSDTLLGTMQDPSPDVRAQSVWSYARVAWLCNTAVGPVKNMVEHDPERNVRLAALEAVRVGWPDDPSLYDFLLRRLKNVGDQDERAHIALAIGGLDAPPIDTLPTLIEALSSDEWAVDNYVAVALGKLGPAARPALPALARLARGDLAEPHGATDTIEAIRLIDPDSPEAQALVVPLALLLRDSPSEYQRQKAMFQLARFGPAALPAIGTLRSALKSPKPDVKERAILVLGFMGSSARPAIVDLDKLIHHDPDLSVRHSAEESVARIQAAVPNKPAATH
jgi:HEAT repeat protein